MDASVANIRAENLTLTQQNLSLRQQITALRSDRLDLQYKLVETIGAKESFKIEVIKLITQAQNTFERLKTFIEHTTSTPPPSMLSGTEKLLRRQIVGGNHGILRQIPIQKDKQQIPVAVQPPQPTPTPQSTSVQNENDDMHFIDEKILKLNTILKKYDRDIKKDIKKENQEVAATTTTNPTISNTNTNTAATTLTKQATKVGNENRRYSKRLQSNVSISNCPVEKHHKDNKENVQMVCAFKDITNGAPMRLAGAAPPPPSHARGLNDENKLNTTPKSRGRKRKVII